MFASNTTQVSEDVNYIESVFQSYLYTGNGSTQTITNGIDLAGEGGMVWTKCRNTASTMHFVYDTNMGPLSYLVPNQTWQKDYYGTAANNGLTAFNADGFSLGANNATAESNVSGQTYASWTFRKQAKFFDVVTFTSSASGNKTFSHNLGSTPGCVIIKNTQTSDPWLVYHRSVGNDAYLLLNSTAAQDPLVGAFSATSTTFTISSFLMYNSQSYVAYIFAHDSGGFGLTGTDNVISCGSYTGNGSATGPSISLGYEPQWLLIKNASSSANWQLIDTMRGFSMGDDWPLIPNLSNAETDYQVANPSATGFDISTTSFVANTSGATYIYIAIRRGPMKTPTTGTSVFEPAIRAGTGTTATVTSNVSPIDMLFSTNRDRVASSVNSFWDRLRGGGVYLNSNATNAEASSTSVSGFDVQNGVTMQGALITNGNSYPYVNYNFQRAPGFFDEVCYTGTGSLPGVAHNLGVTPELKIIKRRNFATDWVVGGSIIGEDGYVFLNTTAAFTSSSNYWDGGNDSATVFSVRNTNSMSDASGGTYVAYLFASAPGVSKVGSYTGTGTTQQINCGFTTGARFVLIKRTDSTGDWYVWDSARGIVSGNDPYLLLNKQVWPLLLATEH